MPFDDNLRTVFVERIEFEDGTEGPITLTVVSSILRKKSGYRLNVEEKRGFIFRSKSRLRDSLSYSSNLVKNLYRNPSDLFVVWREETVFDPPCLLSSVLFRHTLHGSQRLVQRPEPVVWLALFVRQLQVLLKLFHADALQHTLREVHAETTNELKLLKRVSPALGFYSSHFHATMVARTMLYEQPWY